VDSLLDSDDDRRAHGESLRACHRHEPDGSGRPSGSNVAPDGLDLAQESAKPFLGVHDIVEIAEQ
jgi:hypothetical protein